MSVYLYMQAHVDVCVSNICALSPHSIWGSERHRSVRVPQPRLAWHPRSGRGDVLPVPAPPPIPTCHCPPDPPRWGFHSAHCACGAAVTAVTTVPPKDVWGGGTLLCSPGFQGLVLAGRMRLVKSLAQVPVRVGAMGCSRLPVLHCASFISSCVLINQAGPLPAESSSGWVAEEGAHGKHSCAPGTHRNLSQSPWGLCYSRFWAKITQRRGLWLYLSPWGEMWLQGIPGPESRIWCFRCAGRAGSPGRYPTLQSHSSWRCCLTLLLISTKVTTSPSSLFLPV